MKPKKIIVVCRGGMSCHSGRREEGCGLIPQTVYPFSTLFRHMGRRIAASPPFERENRGRDFHNWENGIIFARRKEMCGKDNTEL